MLYEIQGLTDLNGKSKDKRLKEIENNYSLKGRLWGKPKKNLPMMFFYDGSTMCMITSDITDCEYIQEDKLYIVTTKNSIYYLKELD